MRNNWKIDEWKKAEVIGIIKGHKSRVKAFFLNPCEKNITLSNIDDLRKIQAVDRALNDVTLFSDDAEYTKEMLLLNIGNYRKHPYISFNTSLTEWQFFDMKNRLIYEVSENLKK